MAVQFQTTLIDCNGPFPNENTSTCLSFSSFNQIELKSLISVTIPLNPSESVIKLEDSHGMLWERHLKNCQTRLSDPKGCRIVIKQSQKITTVQIWEWKMGMPYQIMNLFISNGTMSVYSDSDDHFFFETTIEQ
jgi:hypothetical protein